MVDLTVLGIIIGIIGQGISALGLILQKKAHAAIQDRVNSGKKKKKWFADPQWLIAFLIFFGGNMMNVVALTFASQSIISALVVLVLVFNAILAPLLLKGEKIQKIDVLGVAIIVCGVVLVVVFGPKTGRRFTSDELLRLWIKTAFVIYGLIILGVVVALICFNHYVETKTITEDIKKLMQQEKEREKEEKRLEKEITKTMTRQEKKKYMREKAEDEEDELAYEKENGIVRSPTNIVPETGPNAAGSPFNLEHRLGKLTAVLYAVLPAILSSFNSLFSKILGEVVLTTARGDNQFTQWPTYLFVVLFAVVDATQVVYLQRALRSYSALYIIPLYQVSLTVFGVSTGGIYFQEFNDFENKAAYYPALFTIGILIAVSGVGVLSKRTPTAAIDTAKPAGAAVAQEKDLNKAIEEGPVPVTEINAESTEAVITDPNAPQATVGTLFVYAVLTGVKWYVKGGGQDEAELPHLDENGEPVEEVKIGGSTPVAKSASSRGLPIDNTLTRSQGSRNVPLEDSKEPNGAVNLDDSSNSSPEEESLMETSPVLRSPVMRSPVLRSSMSKHV